MDIVVRRKKVTFIIFLFVWCNFLNGSAAASDRITSNNFLEQYSAYQGYVKSGSDAIKQKDYNRAIEQYSKAIDLSPFESSSKALVGPP